MALHGEGFLLFNVLMDGIALASALRFLGVRVRLCRVAAASLLGGLYALLSLCIEPQASLGGLLMGALCMSAAAFPMGRILSGTGALLLIGLCGSGTAQLLSGWGPPMALGGAALFMLSFGWLGPKGRQPRRGVAQIELGGERLFIPVLVDTGNVLRDPQSGLPVLVVPGEWIPPYVRSSMVTYPVAAVTAAGHVIMQGFIPEGCSLNLSPGRKKQCRIAVALTDAPMPLALFPAGALGGQDDRKEERHAKTESRRGNAGVAGDALVRAEKRHGGLYRRCRTASAAADGTGREGTGHETCKG